MTNSCWGQVWGSREVNSSGHKPGVNTRCSEEWGRLTASPGTSERTPNGQCTALERAQQHFSQSWLELVGEQRVQALELGQGLLVGRTRVLHEMTTYWIPV